MIKMALGSFALLLLVGCADRAEIARQVQEAEIAQCLDYGFERGTEAFGLCRMRIAEMRQQRQAAENAAVMGLATGLYGNGGAFRPALTCYQMGVVTRCR